MFALVLQKNLGKEILLKKSADLHPIKQGNLCTSKEQFFRGLQNPFSLHKIG
jgi:hypothetical protein